MVMCGLLLMHACIDHHSGALACGIIIAENIGLYSLGEME